MCNIIYIYGVTKGVIMRTEKEMFDLILGVANRDNRVRAVYMNGSRANSNAKMIFFRTITLFMLLLKQHPF